MITYKETKKNMEIRGIEFTNVQFTFSLMVAIGIDKYDAYNLTIVPDKINKIKDDKLSEFEDKCKKDCDILIEQNNIIQLIDYLKGRYNWQINDAAMNTEDVEVTPKMLKNLLGRIIKASCDDLKNASYSDLIRVVDQYCKQFNIGDDDDDDEFQKHFVQIYSPYSAICCECNREFDLAPNCTCVCPHCGHKYIYDKENNKFIY